MAAILNRGPMAKLFLWTNSIHNFELSPFDGELSYDFWEIIVGLIFMLLAIKKKKQKKRFFISYWRICVTLRAVIAGFNCILYNP